MHQSIVLKTSVAVLLLAFANDARTRFIALTNPNSSDEHNSKYEGSVGPISRYWGGGAPVGVWLAQNAKGVGALIRSEAVSD